MRPKKVILLVNADEAQLGMQRFMLETRGFHVLMALDVADALILHAREVVDLVLGFAGKHGRSRGPLDWNALCRSIKVDPLLSTPILLVGPKLNADELYNADGVVVDERVSTVELMERVRLMAARKRGPRKAVGLPALALAGD
jgi:two-component system response regulator CpxR